MKSLEETIKEVIGKKIARPLTDAQMALWKQDRDPILNQVERKTFLTTQQMTTIGLCYGQAMLLGANVPPCRGCKGGDWIRRVGLVEQIYQAQKRWNSTQKMMETKRKKKKVADKDGD